MDKIESLQFNENQKVYEKAISILEQYFVLEDQDDIAGMLQNTPATSAEMSSLDQFN